MNGKSSIIIRHSFCLISHKNCSELPQNKQLKSQRSKTYFFLLKSIEKLTFEPLWNKPAINENDVLFSKMAGKLGKRKLIRVLLSGVEPVDCSQSPIFPWDFRDLYASIQLPLSLFVRASTTWGECLNF